MTQWLGRFCQRHQWIVLACWLLVMVAGVMAAGPVFQSIASPKASENVESFKALNVLSEDSDRGDSVLAIVDGVDPKSDAVKSPVSKAATDLRGIAGVREVRDPFGDPAQAAGLLSEDGRAFLIDVQLNMLEDAEQVTAVEKVQERLEALDKEIPGATVRVGGTPVRDAETAELAGKDFARGELISLPLTIIVLIIVFGGFIAGMLPLVATIATVIGSFLVLFGFSNFINLDANVLTIVTLLSLGLSIDYGLLLVARYKEELGRGYAPEDALPRTWASAGRTVAFSAMTVALSLAGLLVFNVSALRAIASAGIAAVLAAMLSSLTLTAALLRIARKRVKPSKRSAKRQDSGAEETGFFARLAGWVQRYPVPVLIGSVVVLLAFGAPVLGAKVLMNGSKILPDDLPAVQVDDALQNRFGRPADPAITVLARMDPAALDSWAAGHRSDAGVASVGQARAVSDTLSVVDFSVRGESNSAEARDLVTTLRADRPTKESWVTGSSAVLVDALEQIKRGLPWAALIIVLAMMVLLFLLTGSLVMPVKALLMNVVSLGATFGVIVAVVQKGWLADPFDIIVTGGVDPFIMLVVLAFAFGLSMDYEVFLLGRITELVEQGVPSDVAVRRGLQRTGRIITSAAALMLIVFIAFSTAKMGAVEQVGLGLAVAVLVDATIVRCLLVPATMTLLGQWNWWAPAALKRFHGRYGLREEPAGMERAPEQTGPPPVSVNV